MKYVILFRGEHELSTPALLDVLREAGVTTDLAPADLPQEEGDKISARPLAVLYEVKDGVDAAQIHTAINRAAALWPRVPMVAFRSYLPEDKQHYGRRLETAALKRLGFHAVAEAPAQVPALLHEIEESGVADESPLPEHEITSAPPSILLPERLSVRRLRAAFEMVASLHFATNQQSAAQTALAGLAPLIRADRWTIYLMNKASRTGEMCLAPLAIRGLTASERQLPESDGQSALLNEAIVLSSAESRAARAAISRAEMVKRTEVERHVIAVPLISGEQVLGVLEVVREGVKRRAFSAADADLLSALAVPLTASLSNTVRIAEAERLSQTDDLTKLHNARFLRQYLTNEIKRAQRYGSTVAALFLDLDDFKKVNDKYGHLVGSHVLMETAAVILSCVRDTDVVARYGGDEFVVILPETTADHAVIVAQRVREKLAHHVFTGGRRLRLSLTASFGVAAFPQHAQSPQQLIASADGAMYEAKAMNKNCVCFATSLNQKLKVN